MNDVFLGTSDGDYQSMGLPADWSVEAAAAAVRGVWQGDTPPMWVASSSAALAEAVSEVFGGIEISAVPTIQVIM